MKWVIVSLVLCLCASLVFAEAENQETEVMDKHPERVSNRQEEVLPTGVEDRVSLLFRRLDTDYDKKINVDDIKRAEHVLNEQVPGITVPQFIEFMEKADTDKDHMMSRDEFVAAIATGLQDEANPEFLETTAELKRQGFIGAVKNFVKGVVNNAKQAVTGALRRIAGTVDTTQDSCVMCQYVVERIETNVKASGVINGLGAPGPAAGDAFSFVEVDQQEQGPWQAAGAAIITSTRQTTRYQRQLERQKFNEIYRIADITLDDVCEQGMPNKYYGFCKSVYKVQSDIVDGLRYQYRPTDICYRAGMCKKDSYVTRGIHSRYRTDN